MWLTHKHGFTRAQEHEDGALKKNGYRQLLSASGSFSLAFGDSRQRRLLRSRSQLPVRIAAPSPAP